MKGKRIKLLAAVAMAATSALAVAGLASCGEQAAEVAEVATGYVSTGRYQEYTDLGGYGSDFTMFNYSALTLYSDNTYVMDVHYMNWAGAWSVIITETDSTVYGTYTTVSSDEYGIVVDLSAATRVVQRSTVSSTILVMDTDDVSTFTATEEKTAAELQSELLASFAATSGVEIEYENSVLTLPSAE